MSAATNHNVELLSPEIAPFLFYVANAVPQSEARSLVAYLDTVPICSDGLDLTREFAFVPQEYEGAPASRRSEAAAGDPVWLGNRWGRAIEMPAPIRVLRRRVARMARRVPFRSVLGIDPRPTFSSVYVDRYEPGGHFFPHVDGEASYGGIIAGVSLGGPAVFALWSSDDVASAPAAEFVLQPNSTYFFCGPIRYLPWLHSIRGMGTRRYGITFRDPPGRPLSSPDATT